VRCPERTATAGARGRGLLRLIGFALLAAAGIVWIAPAAALGVGSLRTQSALNQPFYGEIDLFDLGQTELDVIKVSLASRSAYEQAGIDRPHFLTRLQFTPMASPRGDPVIQVITREPIREPYLDLLVEVIWPNGRLVKEYAVLLDPPAVGSDRVERVNKSRAPPAQQSLGAAKPSPLVQAASAAREQGEDSRRAGPTAYETAQSGTSASASRTPAAEVTVVEQVASVEVPAVSADVAFPLRYGPVPPGAGLARIARRLAPPGATVEQTALALYRNSQDAFVGGDINRLRLGAELSIPNAAELFVLDPEAARVAYREALAGRPSARAPLTGADVRLSIATRAETDNTSAGSETLQAFQPTAEDAVVTSSAADSTAPQAEAVEAEILLMREASEANRQEAAELRDRIRSLEAQLGDIRKLLELRNQQLAQLALAGVPPLDLGGSAQPDPLAAGEHRPRGAPRQGMPPAIDVAAEVLRAEPSADDLETVDSVLEEGEQAQTEGVESELPETDPQPIESAAPSLVEDETVEVPGSSLSDDAVDKQSVASGTDKPDSALAAQPSPAADAGGREETHGDLLSGLASLRAAMPQWVLPSIAVVLVLALIGLRMQVRRRGQVTEARPVVHNGAGSALPTRGRTVDLALDPDWPLANGAGADAPVAFDAATSEPGVGEARATAVTEEPQALDSFSEADLYLAYGRYRDAERVLQEAATSRPSPQLRFKLAEVYRKSGDLAALEGLADKMREAGDPLSDAARWAEIERAMGGEGRASDGATPDQALGPAVASVNAERLAETEPAPERTLELQSQFESSSALELEPELEAGPKPGLEPAGEPEPEPADELKSDADELYLDLDDLEDLIEAPESDAQETPHDIDASVDKRSAAPVEDAADELLELDLSALDAMTEMPSEPGRPPDAGVPGPEDGDAGLPRLEDLPDLSIEALEPSAGADVAIEDAPTDDVRLTGVERRGLQDQDRAPTESGADGSEAGGWSLEVDELDEVALKLDLARAYLDMDDTDAAVVILNEVVAEGRDDQQAAARDLLAKIE
jgi:pilus assembly protein FimV